MTPEALEQLLTEKLGIQVRRSGQNLTACCPSHTETRPSWGIRIDDPHVHACFACGYRGTLRTLLLDRGWTITAVTNLLGQFKKPSKGFTLNPIEPAEAEEPNEEEIWPFVLEADAVRYMRSREIDYSILVKARVVYHPLDQRVLFPWYWGSKFLGATGRTIDSTNPVKIQAYFGLRKRQCLYSPIGKLVTRKPLVLVEGEIDALKVLQAGFNVIALGHNHLSANQVAMFESLPVNFPFVLMFDRDEVGQKLSLAAFKELRRFGFTNVRCVNWELLFGRFYGKVDPGAISNSAIGKLIRQAKPVTDWSLK